MNGELFSSGDVARLTELSRSSLLYRIKREKLPDATHRVAKRRVFTADDLTAIRGLLEKNPGLRLRQRAPRPTDPRTVRDRAPEVRQRPPSTGGELGAAVTPGGADVRTTVEPAVAM